MTTKTKAAPAETMTLEPMPASLPAVRQESLPAIAPGSTPLQAAMQIAMQRGANGLDQLERFIAMQVQHEKREAEKAFTKAMAGFKAEPLEIFKRKTVDFTSSKGRTHYQHAGLDDVVDIVAPAMARHGLSHRWEPRQDGTNVSVTTVVTHVGGHSERVTLSGPKDDSGNKNSLQSVASAITYLSRYGLLSICGLATKDENDDDGRKGGGEGSSGEDDGDPQAQAWLDAARAASLEGDAALRKWWNDAKPSEAWWRANRDSLRDAAVKADKDAAP